jgi:hypothetical protein
MPFLLRPSRRFPVHCTVRYNAGLSQGQGTVWNFSLTGWRLFGDLPMRPGETLSLTVSCQISNGSRSPKPSQVV